MQEWGDLKFFLATARTGSTLGAARTLGVNQTTVARRIDALETALGVRLFDRNRDGYRLSEGGTVILPQAERIAAEVESLERLVARHNRHSSNVIRVTTTEAIADVILTPWLAEFMERHPHIKLEIFATERRLDLTCGEADIAIRPVYKPAEDGFVMRKLAEGRWTLYCSWEYAKKHGKPACADDLNDHLVIGAEGSFAKLEPLIWLATAASQATIRTVCGTVSSTFVAIRTGHGVGALPSLIGTHPELTECSIMPGFDFGFYLVTPESLKDVPCVKAFTAFIMARAPALKRALEARQRVG